MEQKFKKLQSETTMKNNDYIKIKYTKNNK